MKREKWYVKYAGTLSAFTIGVLGVVLLFFEQSHSIAPFLIGFGFSMGMMRIWREK